MTTRPHDKIHTSHSIRNQIYHMVDAIEPIDEIERQQIAETLEWVQSDSEIFRIEKPDIPPKHLVAYCVLYDPHSKKVLLTDHRACDLWLPTGGHVDYEEHPRMTAVRELKEELFLDAPLFCEEPMFLSSTEARYNQHTDVALWFVFNGDSEHLPDFDRREFRSVRWFSFDEISYDSAEANMSRFLNKLTSQSS